MKEHFIYPYARGLVLLQHIPAGDILPSSTYTEQSSQAVWYDGRQPGLPLLALQPLFCCIEPYFVSTEHFLFL